MILSLRSSMRSGGIISAHWGKEIFVPLGNAICSVVDSLGFEVSEKYHSRAVQQWLNNTRVEMSSGAWEV